ncbi:MAG TPA: hypothetical protein VFU88_17715 [Ktedonobacterales bacterium]|jgi:hypothetical protein|nr:hypothetical protein [Ktedonobacterales bacterium]
MFDDPNHPTVQTLAAHHDAGTHDQIPADQAAAAVESFHQNADPTLVQQVTDQHYDQMAPDQLQQAAEQFKEKIAGVAGSNPEAAQLAAVDPAAATPQQVAAMHRFVLKEHPELMKEILIGGAATIAVGALAAFAARRFLAHHGR